MEENKNGMIIIGGPQSGKTVLANFICRSHAEGEVIQLDGLSLKSFEDPFLFARLTPQHKVIHIDDVVCIDVLYKCIELVNSFITVHAKNINPWDRVCPTLIITSDAFSMDQLKAKGAKLLDKFEVIELNGCSYPSFNSHLSAKEFAAFAYKNLPINQLFAPKDLYEKFLSENISGASYTQFKIYIKEYAKENNYIYNPDLLANNDGRIISAVGGRWLELIFLASPESYKMGYPEAPVID